jgi:glutaminase
VSGGIFGVVKRQLSLGAHSPKLDPEGNSVRGILACKQLASHFGLHAFELTNVGSNLMQLAVLRTEGRDHTPHADLPRGEGEYPS